MMINHAVDESPNECCGILAGRGNRITTLFRCRNIDHSPVTYQIEPQDHHRVEKEIEVQRLELVGFYHSHVRTPAYPSRTDVAKATYPDALYVIVSLRETRDPEVRAFRIRDTRFEGRILANISGDIAGGVEGNFQGDITGSMTDRLNSVITGDISRRFFPRFSYDFKAEIAGRITGKVIREIFEEELAVV